MSGITDLGILLESLMPILGDGEFVLVTRPNVGYGDGIELNPIVTFTERQSVTKVHGRCQTSMVVLWPI